MDALTQPNDEIEESRDWLFRELDNIATPGSNPAGVVEAIENLIEKRCSLLFLAEMQKLASKICPTFPVKAGGA